MIYLMMAVLWVGVALTAFLMPHFKPDGPAWTFPNTDISVGWVALVFLIYNLARWWTSRAQKPADRRLLRPVRRHAPSDETSDPRFQFREGPPKE
jgi:hypothetical protein